MAGKRRGAARRALDEVVLRLQDIFYHDRMLAVAAALAVLSMALVPPGPAYAGYIDVRTLALLFCLMAVVAGLTRAGLLSRLSNMLARRAGTARSLAAVLTACVFVCAMLMTNDVALITFVPVTLSMLDGAPPRAKALAVAAQTVAANLGSMLTPIGNPQNLYLYSAFHLTLDEFAATMLPLALPAAVASLAPVALVPRTPLRARDDAAGAALDGRRVALHVALFAVSVAAVAHLVPWQACLALVAAAGMLLDRDALRGVDYRLLATFVCFFVVIGNVGNLPAVRDLAAGLLDGREAIVAALASQVMSNVPAAIMLSQFTDNVAGLLVGTNLGGLGTPIASLASLISMRVYARMDRQGSAQYMRTFLLLNGVLLVLALVAVQALGLGR